VTGMDGNGCKNTDTVTVQVTTNGIGLYVMPSAFTPNGDGKNDCFHVSYWGLVKDLEFSIYNRWGNRVFYTKDPSACWDGNWNGIPQAPGVFIYMIKASTNCQPQVFRKGTFVLIR
jgi:gliding motility-associated-like protein